MDAETAAIRVVLGAIVFGFVASSVGASLGFVGFPRSFTLTIGVVVGALVFVLVLFKSKRVR